MIDFQKIAGIISGNSSFVITTHVNPDADAIGSEIALSGILHKLNKKVKIINHSAAPYNLEFLDNRKEIEKYDPQQHDKFLNEYDVLVALDFNRAERLVSMRETFRKSDKLKICIDHHQDPENFVDHLFVDSQYAASGHILYDLIKTTKIVEMSKEIAYPLYAAIMTDTGSFRFERTDSKLHRIIADLLEYNVSPAEIYDKLYDESKFSKLKLLGKSLETLTLEGNGKIGYMVITQQMFKDTSAVESDTENFVNFALSIEGVILAILFIELKEGFKVSFRSKGNLPVNKLAGEFDGGGHINASGARFRNSDLQKMIPVILNKAKEYSEKY